MRDRRVIKVANYNSHAVTARIGWQWIVMGPGTLLTATMPNCSLPICIYDSEMKELIDALMMGTGTPWAAIYHGT